MYLTKKHIQMKPIMKTIYDRLTNDQPISKRQLEVIVPYLKNDLKDHTTEQIFDHFSCCIYDYSTVSDYDFVEKYYTHIIKENIRMTTPTTLDEILN